MPRSTWTIPRLVTSVVLLLALVVPKGGAQEYERSLNRTNTEPALAAIFSESLADQLRIVPESRLRDQLTSASPVDPIPAEQMADFLATVEAVTQKGGPDACSASPADLGDYSPGDAAENVLTIIDVAQANSAVLVGQVESITTGWDFHYRSVTSLTYFRVDEVLKTRDGLVRPGDLVTYEQPWGSMEMVGMTLCTSPPEGLLESEAKVGQRLVVVGSEDLNNPLHLVTNQGFLFRLTGSSVYPPPHSRYPQYREDPIPLRELQREVGQ